MKRLQLEETRIQESATEVFAETINLTVNGITNKNELKHLFLFLFLFFMTFNFYDIYMLLTNYYYFSKVVF